MPTWINMPGILAVAGAIFILLVYKLAVTITARANKADHDNAFGQSLVGLIGLFWFAVATLGAVAISAIGLGLYNLVINNQPTP